MPVVKIKVRWGSIKIDLTRGCLVGDQYKVFEVEQDWFRHARKKRPVAGHALPTSSGSSASFLECNLQFAHDCWFVLLFKGRRVATKRFEACLRLPHVPLTESSSTQCMVVIIIVSSIITCNLFSHYLGWAGSRIIKSESGGAEWFNWEKIKECSVSRRKMVRSHLNFEHFLTRCGNVESHNSMSEIGSRSKIALAEGVWMKFKFAANESKDCCIHSQADKYFSGPSSAMPNP